MKGNPKLLTTPKNNQGKERFIRTRTVGLLIIIIKYLSLNLVYVCE